MSTRLFGLALATILLATLQPAEAQQPTKVPRIGLLFPGSPGPSPAVDAFRRGLREHGYVEATAAFYRDHDKLNHRTRAQAFEAELEKLAQRYPDDREAAILHALVLSANFDPTDKQYTNQLRAARILVSTCWPTERSVSRSSPKTFTATLARVPDSM